MNTEPKNIKLLTEAEWRDWRCVEWERARGFLRERGLIAEEPVDPLLVEAREICAEAFGCDYSRATVKSRGALRATYNALRRGMELQREKLTVEVVDEALVDAVTRMAVEIVGKRIDLSATTAKPIENHWAVKCVKEGIEYGMELAPRKELTREMVREAVAGAGRCLQYGSSVSVWVIDDLDRLHAALTEALQ